jgi:D-alanyl-D-alanine carboxypeptidase
MIMNPITALLRSRRLAAAAALVTVLAVLPGAEYQAAAAASTAFSPAIQRQLQQALAQSVANPAVPGMIVGIWIPGHGTWVRAAGLADRTSKRPMQVQDSMRIGSVTKTFMATLILQLVGDGKLRLDDPITRWAPQVPNGQHITIRELLNMSSGLFNYTEDPLWVQQAFSPRTGPARRQWTPQQLIQVAVAHRPYFPPGTGWHYSNTNYILLGEIIEQVTGRPVAEVLRTRILQPLGLTHTVYPTTQAMPNPHAQGYATQLGSSILTDVTRTNPSWAGTAGAMISTLDDLHTWAQALATGTLLGAAQQRERLTWNPYAALPTHGLTQYGLGVAQLVGFLGHSGGLPGFNTEMWYLPTTHATVVVMANSDNSITVPPQQELDPANLLLQRIVQVVFPAQYPH